MPLVLPLFGRRSPCGPSEKKSDRNPRSGAACDSQNVLPSKSETRSCTRPTAPWYPTEIGVSGTQCGSTTERAEILGGMGRADDAGMLRPALVSSAVSLFSLVVTGCSGGVAPADLGSTDPKGTGAGSSGDTGSSPAASEPLPVAGVAKVLLSDGVCGAAPGYCHGRESVEVDLTTGGLVRTACVEQEADPSSKGRLPTTTSSTSRALTAEELQRVRDALGAVRFTGEISTAQDGHMTALTVTSTSGSTQRYSPAATCGQSSFKTIVGGFDAVTKVLYGL